jgi:hypothetical protein
MKYCREHDLMFCEQHTGTCFQKDDCRYEDVAYAGLAVIANELSSTATATFCCVCTGRYIPPALEDALQAGDVSLYKPS